MLLALVTVWLTSCGRVTSEDALRACPVPYNYDVKFQSQLADELTSLPVTYTALPQAIVDYGVLRKELRAR